MADGKKVNYQVRNYADGSGNIEVFYYEADGFRRGAVGKKQAYKVQTVAKTGDGKTYIKETIKTETRKQLIKRLCESLGIAA